MDSQFLGQIPGMQQSPMMPGLPMPGGAMPGIPGMGQSTPMPAGLDTLGGPMLGADGLDYLPSIKPKYRSWYKPEKQPTVEKILALYTQKDTRFLERNLGIAEAIAALRLHISGSFRDDVRDRETGRKEGYISTSLLDEWNVLWALISGIDRVYNKDVRHPDQAIKSQLMEDVAYDAREKAERFWLRRGDMPLRIAEAKVLTMYGCLVTRITADLYDSDYPFDHCLIDPATIYPEYEGKRGLKRVLRIFKANLADVVFDFYSDDDKIPADVRKKLKMRDDGTIDDIASQEEEFIEYWDRTWCAVICADGTIIKPIHRHDYGVVPYVISYGPGGEPMFTQPQNYYMHYRNGRLAPYESRTGEHTRYKATSAIRNGMVRNAQEEALSSLIMEEIRKAANPPVIWKRSIMAAGNKQRVVIDGRRGGISELFQGEEELESFPTAPNPGLLQMMMQFLGKNSQSNSIPMSLLGQINQSNVSGTAVSSAADSGMDKIAPWIYTTESHSEEEFALTMEIWRNAGHLSRYMQEAPTSYTVPNRNVKFAVHELTPEILDELGYSIKCKMTKLRNGELLPMGNALKVLNEAGFMSKQTASEYLGITDYHREQELWRNERAVDLAFQEPEFIKVFTVPTAIQQVIKSLEGDPAQQAFFEVLLDEWMEMISAPTRMQLQAQSQPQPAAIGAGQMGAAPPGGAGIVNPSSPAGMSFEQLNQGPGSVTGQQGGPPPAMGGMGGAPMQGNPMAGM